MMFESVGHAAQLKPLSSARWFYSAGIMALTWATGISLSLAIHDNPVMQRTMEKLPIPEVFRGPVARPPAPPAAPMVVVERPPVRPALPHITRQTTASVIEPPVAPIVPIETHTMPMVENENASHSDEIIDISEADNGLNSGPDRPFSGRVFPPGSESTIALAPPELQSIEFSPGEFLNARDVQRRALQHFPEILKRANIPRAEAVVELSCNASGEVVAVEWISGNELVMDAVIEAAHHARFSARPYAFRVRVPFRFLLN